MYSISVIQRFVLIYVNLRFFNSESLKKGNGIQRKNVMKKNYPCVIMLFLLVIN